jgi:transposase
MGPLLPPEPSKPRGGRPRVPDRTVLTGIVYVLKSGIPWRMLRLRLRALPEVSASPGQQGAHSKWRVVGREFGPC